MAYWSKANNTSNIAIDLAAKSANPDQRVFIMELVDLVITFGQGLVNLCIACSKTVLSG